MFGINRLSLPELQARAAAHKLRGTFFVSNEDYHAGPGWSSTTLKLLLRSPIHAHVHKEPTDAMQCGTAMHEALLEPEVFAKKYLVEPKWEYPGNIKAGIKERGDYYAKYPAHPPEHFLTHDDGKAVDGLVRRAAASSTFQKLIAGAQYELAAYWVDPDTGLLCKAKADIWNGTLLADLKSTLDASWDEFRRTIGKYDYHVSAAFYLDGFSQALRLPMSAFIFIPIEKKYPHGMAFYSIDADGIECGRALYKKALGIIKEQGKKPRSEWPCYSDSIQSISLAGFAKSKYENN